MTAAPLVPRLASTGQVYVTLAAARIYAQAAGVEIEQARRELTLWLLDAVEVDRGAVPEKWRWRRRSRVDVSALVVREGPLALVVSVGVRSTR